MGIKGLLPTLEHTKVKVTLAHFKGKRVAIDGHCWLHSSLICCAFELETGVKTEKYVTAFRNKINKFLYYGVIPVVVFDGQGLPLKAGTAKQREENRNEARKRGFQHLSKGDKKGAYKEFIRSAKITSEMINDVIKMLDILKIEHIIAPYEADPQLSYLCRTGFVDAVLTMDSDLLVFQCPHIIFQRHGLDNLSYIQFDNLFNKLPTKKDGLNMTTWTPALFRQMCILIGCDYIENMSGMGMKTAYRYVSSKTPLETIVRSFYEKSEEEEMKEYMTNFKMAEAGFLHQIVYDPRLKKCVRLNPLTDDIGLTEAQLALLGMMPTVSGPSVIDTTKVVEVEEEEAICPSLSTTKDDEEEEEILSTPLEQNLPLSVKSDVKKVQSTLSFPVIPTTAPPTTHSNKSVGLQDKTNTLTAQELAASFQQKNAASLIRQKSVLGSLKRIQSPNIAQTTLGAFMNHHRQQQEKKRKFETKENAGLNALFNTKRRSAPHQTFFS